MSRTDNTFISSSDTSDSVRAAVDLSVVIPAYNEEGAIGQTVTEVHESLSSLPLDFEIIVVDDGSTDGTREAAEKGGAKVISNAENRGYGAALKVGIGVGNSAYVAI